METTFGTYRGLLIVFLLLCLPEVHSRATAGKVAGSPSTDAGKRDIEVSVATGMAVNQMPDIMAGELKGGFSHFFSKSDGDLDRLETWGTEPDGSGASPLSFDLDMAVFNLVNRESATLDGDLHTGGNESLFVAGNGTDRLVFVVNGSLDADVVVENHASVRLGNSLVPRFVELKDGSTVIFSGNAHAVPGASFYNLVFDNIDPVFEGEAEIGIRGSLELAGSVQMPDARGEQRYDLLFSGSADQAITGNGNVIRSFNLIIAKTGGSVDLSAGNGGTLLSADNQIIVNLAPGARFADNGNEIYAGNSVNTDGSAGSYDLTGTLILADYIEGVVNGAGNNNNFNIRDSGSSNSNAAAIFNNIIIKAANRGGEFRFRDGAGDRLNVKGNFIIGPAVEGRVDFYGNSVAIGGNFIIDEGFAGTVAPLKALVLEGERPQEIIAGTDLAVETLIINNSHGPTLSGQIAITGNLHFEAGRLVTRGGGLPVLGTNAVVAGYGGQKFVDGPLGIQLESTGPADLLFPLGSEDAYNPLIIKATHSNDNPMLYVAEFFTGPPPPHNLPAGLPEILDDFYFDLDIRGDGNTISAIATMNIDRISDPGTGSLRIVKSEQDSWLHLGGTLENGTLSSTIPLTGPGILAVAKGAPDVLIVSGAGPGGSINPPGETILIPPARQSYIITADDGYHIENIFIDGIPLENPPGYFTYTYTFINPAGNKTIHADFAPNEYLDIDIFPNPASDRLYVRFRQNLEHVARVSLVTLNGVVVTEKTLSPEGNNSGFIRLEGVEPGLYMVKISYGQYIINKKVMIM